MPAVRSPNQSHSAAVWVHDPCKQTSDNENRRESIESNVNDQWDMLVRRFVPEFGVLQFLL